MFAAENGLSGDPRLQGIYEAIRVVPNFPKPGIMFQDITSLVSNHRVFKDTIDILVDRYKNMGISVVAGVEARGFIFAPAIALEIGAKFIPLRKPGKLPGAVISESYELEYGKDCLQMHVGAVNIGERVLVIDDLVATGGTLSAAIRLLERAGAEVVECACIIGLPEVEGRNRLDGKPVYILVEPRQQNYVVCAMHLKEYEVSLHGLLAFWDITPPLLPHQWKSSLSPTSFLGYHTSITTPSMEEFAIAY